MGLSIFNFQFSIVLSLPPASLLPSLGATGVFREATECGFGPTKGSKSPLATVAGSGVGRLGRPFFILLRLLRRR